MYALAIAGSVAAGSAVAMPHFQLGSLDVGIPIQSFGVIVAAGVLIGAALLRRYAEWHGVSDEHIRGILGWITITGFLGAHWFDVLAYEPHKLNESIASWPPSKWPVLLRIWDGISSYGGFVGGAIGFAIYVWWKRLPVRLMADISIVGLLPAFSIGRIGCTVVSDHVGSVVDKAQWYAGLAMNYPRDINLEVVRKALEQRDAYGKPLYPDDGTGTIAMWNLGLIELLYLIPVNALILWFAFRGKKRMPAGFLVVLTGVLYAPVRFFMDYLRPVETDARHMGLTFAQWCSIAAFGVSVYAASRIMKNGKAAETIAPTAGEAQKKLKVILKEDEEKADREEEEKRLEEKRVNDKKAAEDKAAKSKDADKKPEAKKADDKKSEAKKAHDKPVEKTDDKKAASGLAGKASGLAGKSEVPPTEPMIDALPKDIIKKVEDTKAKQADEAKADDAKAEKSEDKESEDKKSDV
jgi:phosphatidylglycerol:prolipoprotein diacylglycerol transferase